MVLHWAGGNKTAHVGNNDGITFGTTDDANDKAAQVNTTSDGMVWRSDGVLVKCKICGGNHWPNKCPNKPSKDKNGNSDNNPSSSNAAPEVEQPSGNNNIANTTVEAEVVASPIEELANLTLQGSAVKDWTQAYSGVSFLPWSQTSRVKSKWPSIMTTS